MNKIYFDYASTTPVDPAVIEAMQPYFFEKFGNASSPHSMGREAKKALEHSREVLAAFIGAKAEEIVFTSGGTESNNFAILGITRALKYKGNHLIISKIEHHSVLEPVLYLEKEGFKITWLEVDSFGLVDIENIRRAITPQTILITLMHASNEIGTIQPIEEVAKIARANNIYFHVDAVQTVGHLPVQVSNIGCHTLALAAHKFYGPKGIGALYIRRGTPVVDFFLGGDQESGRRASTQNVAGAVGMAKAIELCQRQMNDEARTQIKLRDRLIQEIQKRIEGSHLSGHPTQRLPNNVHFAFDHLESESLLMSLDMAGIAASMGSACTSGALEPSHVLKAIGLPDELAFGALRISLGRWTTAEQVDYLLEQLEDCVRKLRLVKG